MYSKISNNKEEYFFIEALPVMVILYSFIHSLNGNGIILGTYFVSGLPFYR